ncbi:MAG: alpha-D-ribose 1-methylphosphonate 5-triphosphate diphosphatase [Aliishimia sp.]
MNVEFVGADVLGEVGFENRPLAIVDGILRDDFSGKQVDLSGFKILPGLIDVHGDGFERHVAPRRGAMKDVSAGIRAAEAEMAANGITTGVLAQFISWEGGLRGEAFATQVFDVLSDIQTITDLRPQLRFETHQLDMYEALPDRLAAWGVAYVVFNDHLPHDRLAAGKTPKRNTAEALRAGRNPEKHLAFVQSLHARTDEVPAALAALSEKLAAQGVKLGSHDDNTAAQRAAWVEMGVEIAEFPETLEAAEAPGQVILGSPNLVRGGSHKGNVSALDVVLMGNCDALASDYHYPSLRRAALFLAKTIGIKPAWDLVSSGPARILGLNDRGRLDAGLRADVVILNAQDRVAATISAGRVSYMSGEIVDRLLA